MTRDLDVLVVGGGPAGAAAGYWLARQGLEVRVVEKKTYPREKTCGDGLTPRAIKQLMDMGFDFNVPAIHKTNGLRAYAGELKLEVPWPEHSIYPNWGAAIRRADLDLLVARLAEAQGAVVEQGTEARAVVEANRLTGVALTNSAGDVETVKPKVTVIADGSLSRFGRSLGTERRRDYPFGLAVRGYYASPNSGDRYLESQLDIRDDGGKALPGYGWIFPLGDGTINVGVGVISTSKGWKNVNTSRVLDAYLAGLPAHWEVTEASVVRRPVGGKLPMAMSVGPKHGANWVAVGDAAGAVNPFNGEGIDYAYETSRLAAPHIAEMVATGDVSHLTRYGAALRDQYEDYHRVARAFSIAIGNPLVMRTLTRTGLRSRPLMEWVLKVMANLLEPHERGMTELVYSAIEKIVKVGPEPLARSR